MPRKIVQPKGLWDPRPRFAQVARAGNTLYIAGQTSVNEKGETVGKNDIEAQARQVFENLKKALAAEGATFDHVVKLNIYSTSPVLHREPVSKVRGQYFTKEAVPSTFVGVPALVNPDWLLEIEAIAVLD